METTETPDCRAADDVIRRAAMDQLVAEVNRREDTFLQDLGDERGPDYELNPYAVAEWAWGLLERQREALTAAVMSAIDDNDNDKDEETT